MKSFLFSFLTALFGLIGLVPSVSAATTVSTPSNFDVKFSQINIGGGPRCTSVLSTFIATFSREVDPKTITLNSVYVLGPNDVPVLGTYTFLQLDSLKKGLAMGSTGADAKKLQIFLYAMGFFPNATPTTYFGSVTKKALMDWQKSLGISMTGVLDAATIAHAHVLVFTPSGPLQEDAVYSMTAATEVHDVSGNPLPRVFRQNMVTGIYCKSSQITSRGIRGLQGIQGIEGLIGVQGIQGLQGIQGIPGVTAFGGPQGESGTQGVQGIQGIQGFIGATGTQGIQGERGSGGSAGAPGSTGATGGSLEATVAHATLKDMTDQRISDTSQSQAILFHENKEVYLINHSTTDNPSRIYPTQEGRYRITTSVQLSGGGVFSIWLRKNGVDVPETARIMTVQNGYSVLTTINVVDSMPGDYFEIMQSSSVPDAGITSVTGLLDPTSPDAPSVILHMIRTGESI